MIALGKFLLSWVITLLGIFLLLLPVYIVRKIAKKRFPNWKMTATGIILGLIAWPLSLWLYSQYFSDDPLRALVFGFIGLFLLMFHTLPFESVSIPFLLEATDLCQGTWGGRVAPYLIMSGVFWAIIYGLIGAALDRFMIWRKEAKGKVCP
jgi:hypothetical protein